jgi:pimeloyl-ACP methyl ester carboxylesterase
MQKRAYELQTAAGDVENEEYPVLPESLTMPVRIVTGAHDFQFFADSATYLMERLPNAERIDLPWAGHLPTLEKPSEALQLIL